MSKDNDEKHLLLTSEIKTDDQLERAYALHDYRMFFKEKTQAKGGEA